jgi:hypothetical protein
MARRASRILKRCSKPSRHDPVDLDRLIERTTHARR